MNNPNAKENLKSFKKGQSGNPAGRRKGSKNVTTQLLAMLKRKAPDSALGKKEIAQYVDHIKRPTNADAMAARLIWEATHGKRAIQAIKEINDRIEGKARQAVEITGKDGKDIIPDGPARVVVYLPDNGRPNIEPEKKGG